METFKYTPEHLNIWPCGRTLAQIPYIPLHWRYPNLMIYLH